MAYKLKVRDETTSGQTIHELTLDILTETMTVRELIRARIYQEVQDYNLHKTDEFCGLVKPSDAEATLNGCRTRKRQDIDWKPQFAKACEAFDAGQVLVLIGNHQVESLDEKVEIRTDTVVSFLRLVPLVGG